MQYAIPIIQRKDLWCLFFSLLHYSTFIVVQGSSSGSGIGSGIGSNHLPPPPPLPHRGPPPPPPPPPLPLKDEANNSSKNDIVEGEETITSTLKSYGDDDNDRGQSLLFHDDSGDGDDNARRNGGTYVEERMDYGRERSSFSNRGNRRRIRRTDYYENNNDNDTDMDTDVDMRMYSDSDYYGQPRKSLKRDTRRGPDDLGTRDDYYNYDDGRYRGRERERSRGRRQERPSREYDGDDISYDYMDRRQQPRSGEQRDDYDDRRERGRSRPLPTDYPNEQWDGRERDSNRRGGRRQERPISDQLQQQRRQQQQRGKEQGEEGEEREERENENKKSKKKSFFSSPFGKTFGTGKSDTAKNDNKKNKNDNDFQQGKKMEGYPKPMRRNDDRDEFDDGYDVFSSTSMENRSGDEDKSYNPIDYQFPSKDILSTDSESKQRGGKGTKDREKDNLPETGWDDDRNRGRFNDRGRPLRENQYANPRRDAVARYTSTKMGKMKLALSSSTCGALLGAFIGKSIFNHAKKSAILFALVFWFAGFLRNAYGEMVRSVALGSIYLLSRTRDVRKRYRTGVHLRTICRLGGGGRVPFPPILDEEGVENPWKYVPETDEDPDFEMIKSLICMVIIGSFCGGNIPLIPTWMGSTGGAAAFAFMAIGKNARGDLIRTMGMRIVATAGEAVDINRELNVARKVAVVAGKILDKALILDRKHRIKDRVLRGATWAFERVSSTVQNVQKDMNDEQRSDRDSKQDDRPRERRPMER